MLTEAPPWPGRLRPAGGRVAAGDRGACERAGRGPRGRCRSGAPSPREPQWIMTQTCRESLCNTCRKRFRGRFRRRPGLRLWLGFRLGQRSRPGPGSGGGSGGTGSGCGSGSGGAPAAAGVPAAPAMVWAAATAAVPGAAAAALAAVAVAGPAAALPVRGAPVPAMPASAGWDRRVFRPRALRECGSDLLPPWDNSRPRGSYPRSGRIRAGGVHAGKHVELTVSGGCCTSKR